MSRLEFELTCPYCGNIFGQGAQVANAESAVDVRCTVYTRDTGRFDPPSLQAERDESRWSTVGTDFLRWAFYEKLGILNTRKSKGQRVLYRVQRCPGCLNLFDVYVSCANAGLPFDQFWPHLFGTPPSGAPEPHNLISLPLWIARRLSWTHGSGAPGVVALCFVLALRPWLMRGADLSTIIPSALLYALAALAIGAILYLYDQIVRGQNNVADLQETFAVSAAEHVIHWRNFTLCRFVGHQEQARRPGVSQVDVFSGGMAAAFLLVARMLQDDLDWRPHALLVVEISVISLLLWLLGPTRLGRLLPFNKAPLASTLAGLFCVVVPSAVMIGASWLPQGLPNSFRAGFAESTDLFFWLIVGYFLAVGFHLSLSSTFYVLRGMTRLPLRGDLFREANSYAPIMLFRRFTYRMMFVVFLALISICSLIEALNQPGVLALWPGLAEIAIHAWLEDWFLASLGIVFGVLSMVADKRFLVILIPYCFVALIVRDMSLPFFSATVTLNVGVLVLGAFLTALFIVLGVQTEASVNLVTTRSRVRAIRAVELLVSDLHAAIMQHATAGPGNHYTLRWRTEIVDSLLRYRTALESLSRRRRIPWVGAGTLTVAGIFLEPLFGFILELGLPSSGP